MHRLSASFVLAYHGCDQAVAERLVQGEPFANSNNKWDWLGDGIYFWEANPQRGLEWAQKLEKHPKSKVKKAAVVGAVIDLRNCLDLSTGIGIGQVSDAYDNFRLTLETANELDKIPSNGRDLMARRLDCAVINWLHKIRTDETLPPIDTIRGIFTEGEELYVNAGFKSQTHVQICVREPECIHGVFWVPQYDLTVKE